MDNFDDKEALDMTDANITINNDPYANIPNCIHTPVSQDDCNPFELKCDGRCNGGGLCLMNPFSEYYNMTMDEYKVAMEEYKQMCADIDAYLATDEGKEAIAKLAEELKKVMDDKNK